MIGMVGMVAAVALTAEQTVRLVEGMVATEELAGIVAKDPI